jgi:hypothetical protein
MLFILLIVINGRKLVWKSIEWHVIHAEFRGNQASGLKYGYVGAMIDMACRGSGIPGPFSWAVNEVH